MKSNVYIDSANLELGSKNIGINIDYKKFNGWLRQKYNTNKIYLFIGLVSKYKKLYKYLQKCGYILVFKETKKDQDGKIKGNCDADLVLKSIVHFYEEKIEHFILVSGDGDFSCLVDFLINNNIKVSILTSTKPSFLLRKTKAHIVYLEKIYKKFSK